MNLLPFYTLFTRECHRFLRVIGQSIFTPMVTSFLYLLIFGVSLGKVFHFFSLHYLEFIVPGLMMMGAINNAYINSASSLIISKYHGDIEDLKTSPLSSFVILNAMGFACSVRAIIVSLAIFCVGEIFTAIYLRSSIFPNHPLLAFFFLLTAGFTFGVLGTSIGCFAKTFETLQAVSQFILLPLIYLGGVFYPIDYLPKIWQKVAVFNPMFYYIDGLRYSFFSVSESSPIFSICFAISFFLLFYVLSYFLVKRSSFKRL